MRYQSRWRLDYVEIIVGADRQQVTLLLEFLDDFIDDDNTVRCNGSICERVGHGFIGLRWESANPAAGQGQGERGDSVYPEAGLMLVSVSMISASMDQNVSTQSSLRG